MFICDKAGCNVRVDESEVIEVSRDGSYFHFCCYAHLYDWAKTQMYNESGLGDNTLSITIYQARRFRKCPINWHISNYFASRE